MQSISYSTNPFISVSFRKLIFLFSFLFLSQATLAQVNLKNLLPYSQTFDSLNLTNTWTDNTTLKGWYVSNATGTTITPSVGVVTQSGLTSYGATGTSDRALGHGTAATYFGIRLKNNTTATITGFSVQYTMEVWFRDNGNNTLTTLFDFQKNTSALTGSSWSVAPGSNSSWASGGAGSIALNGNLPANRVKHIFSLPIILAPGEEVMLRWQLPTGGTNSLGLDDVTITPATANSHVFYNTITTAGVATDITNKANWDTNGNGTGIKPVDFNSGVFVFNSTGGAHNLVTNLTLGTNAKLIVSGGQLIIPANRTLTGNVDVNDNATLTIQSSTLPTFGFLGDLSTVNISSAVDALPALTFGKLVINANNTKALTGHTSINTSLTLGSSSKLELGAYNLTLSPGATLTGGSGSSYIVTNGSGSLKAEIKNNQTDVIFPVGTTNQYSPIKINQLLTATSDVFSVRVIDSVYAGYNNNIPVSKALQNHAYNKTWIIDEEVKGGSNVTISLDVPVNPFQILNLVGGLLGFEINQAKIVHYENNQWDYTNNLPTTVAAISGGFNLSRSGITSFSPFGLMSGSPQALPVELINFTVNRKGKAAISEWRTASEVNNAYFTLERSTDGLLFEPIGNVEGKGTTSRTSDYSFTDLNAPAILTYYRLRQSDLDGSTSVSKIVTVSGAGKTENTFELYPNPSAGQVILRSNAVQVSPVQIWVLNTQGKVIKDQIISAAAFNNGYFLDLKEQANGIYLVKIQTSQESTVLRAVKK